MGFKLDRKVSAKVAIVHNKVALRKEPTESKSLKGKIKISYHNGKIDKVFVVIRGVSYTLDIPSDYKAKYVYSTIYNDSKELNTPAICSKIHFWRSVSTYWSIVYDGMILKVKSINSKDASAEFDAEALEELGQTLLNKYYSKRI